MVWAVTALMAVGVIFAILRAFVVVTPVIKASEFDVQVYKDQLKSLESDLERGVLSQDAAASAKLEISRRILAADKRAQDETVAKTGRTSKAFLAFIGAIMLGGSLGLYFLLGSPQMPDQPLQARMDAAKIARANRPNQVEAEAQVQALAVDADGNYLELIEKLRDTMKTRPTDVEGWKLLVLHESRIGNVRAAWRAKDRIILLLGDKASGEDYTDLAEFMIISTNGYVSTDAETALAKALTRNAKSPRARYYSGLALAQNGRPDVAYRMWIGLLEEGPEDAPWVQLIRGQIGTVARAAGINLVDQNAPGPSADQVEAAGNMTQEARQNMIRGMVAGLAERLATDGGTPAEWARLIRAYGTLGETAQASAIWVEARNVFGDKADAMAILLEAAQSAEVAN